MQVGDVVRVEGDWYGRIVDIGCRRVRVRRGSGVEEDVPLEDVELLGLDEAEVLWVMEA